MTEIPVEMSPAGTKRAPPLTGGELGDGVPVTLPPIETVLVGRITTKLVLVDDKMGVSLAVSWSEVLELPYGWDGTG